jgi:uncharacterized protein YjdB
VRAVALGSATITAMTEGVSSSATITVITAPEPTPATLTLTLYPSVANLYTGQVKQFISLVKNASGNTVSGGTITYTSSNSAVATVSSTGVATARGPGSATITATYTGAAGTAFSTGTVNVVNAL